MRASVIVIAAATIFAAPLGAGYSQSLAQQIWTKPAMLTAPRNVVAVSNPIAALTPAGQKLVAWTQGGQVLARVQLRNIWSATTALTPVGASSVLLDAAEAATGDAAAVFNDGTSTQARFYSAGVWAAPAAVPVSAGGKVQAARLRFDSAGLATLVWTEASATGCQVRASTGRASGTWSAPVELGGGCYSLLQLAVNKRGEAALGLGAPPSGVRHGGSPVLVTSRSRAGTWTGFTNLGSGPYATPPMVGIGENGVAIATFSDANLGVQWSRRSPVDGSWSAPAIVDGAVPAVPTAVAVAANGGAVVIYNSYYTVVPPAPLMAATLKAGSNAWSAPALITDGGSTIDSFQVATSPAGTVVAGWIDTSPVAPAGASTAIGAAVLPLGGVWSNTTLDADLSGLAMAPSPYGIQVAASAGRAMAAWTNAGPPHYSGSALKAAGTTIK